MVMGPSWNVTNLQKVMKFHKIGAFLADIKYLAPEKKDHISKLFLKMSLMQNLSREIVIEKLWNIFLQGLWELC